MATCWKFSIFHWSSLAQVRNSNWCYSFSSGTKLLQDTIEFSVCYIRHSLTALLSSTLIQVGCDLMQCSVRWLPCFSVISGSCILASLLTLINHMIFVQNLYIPGILLWLLKKKNLEHLPPQQYITPSFYLWQSFHSQMVSNPVHIS